MSSKKIFSFSLIVLLMMASFSFATFNVEASDGEYHLILTSSEGGSIVQPESDEDGPVYKEYEEGENVSIEAEADENHEFEEWTGDFDIEQHIEDPKSNYTEIEMNDNYTVTAEFEKETHELFIDVEGEGEVTEPGEGDFDYDHEEEVILKAESSENYVFEEWAGDTEGIEDTEDRFTTITIEDDYDITAEFEEDNYELSIDVDGEG